MVFEYWQVKASKQAEERVFSDLLPVLFSFLETCCARSPRKAARGKPTSFAS